MIVTRSFLSHVVCPKPTLTMPIAFLTAKGRYAIMSSTMGGAARRDDVL